MELSKEIIKNLPQISDEELEEIRLSTEKLVEITLDDFDKACAIIDSIYEQFHGILSQEQIESLITSELRTRNLYS